MLRYFADYVCGLWMKRWRCPHCGSVHTARPEEFSPCCQYSREQQRDSIYTKLSGKPFLKTINRQIQQHWMKTFRIICSRTANWNNPTVILQHLQNKQFHITKRRIYSASWPGACAPYLPFAVTVKQPQFKLE